MAALVQVIKAVSRNPAASALLGKEGVVDTVVAVIGSLAKKNYCPKLKAAFEALAILTRPPGKNSAVVNSPMWQQ